MYPEKIEKNSPYHYCHWEFFQNHLDITWAFVEKNFTRGMHEQEFYEINIIVKGRGVHYINDSRIPAKVGDVFVLPPHVSHGYLGGEGFDVFHILLSDAFMNKYMTDLQQLPSFFALFSAEPLIRTASEKPLHLSLNKSQFEKANGILQGLLLYNDHTDSFQSLMRSHLTMLFIALICDNYTENSYSVETNVPKDVAIMNAISYIHERYNEKITVSDLMRISYLSRTLFIQKFKEICKKSPSEYLTEIRINAAKKLLTDTGYSIAEIAHRTGFYDSAHFTKIFKAQTGIPPMSFRNASK